MPWVHDPGLVLIAGLNAHETRAYAERAFPGVPTPPAASPDELLRERALAVVPLPNLDKGTLEPLLTLARRRRLPCVVLVLDAAPEVVLARDPAQSTPLRRLRHEARALASRLPALLARKVVVAVHHLGDALPAVVRRPLPCDRRQLEGPFDVIGDVHGCLDELDALLDRLGYASHEGVWRHPERTCVFVGDLADRGPNSLGVLTRAMDMVEAGAGLCVMGNHDYKLARYLEGRPKLKVGHGMERTVAELDALPPDARAAFTARARPFLEALPSHLILAGGELVVAHGGIKEELIGRTGSKVQAFTRFGETTGKTDADGFPERLDWADSYSGQAHVVYGHTPVPAPAWRNRTANVDQGCVFGGALTAARFPELEFVQVSAGREYFPR